MNQDNGGIIGKINTPTTSVASGVWSIEQQFEAQSSSTWPLTFPRTTIANTCRFNDGSSDYHIAYLLPVPANIGAVIERPINLNATETLKVQASRASSLDIVANVLEFTP